MNIEKTNESTVCIFNANKNLLSILAIVFLLLFPFFCSWLVIMQNINSDDPVIISILCSTILFAPIIWIFLRGISAFSWTFYGKVIITIDKDKMIIDSKPLDRFRRPLEFDLNKITYLRMIAGEDFKKRYLSHSKGIRRLIALVRTRKYNALLFDYDKCSIKLEFPRLDLEETEELLNIIVDYKDISLS